MLSRLRRFRSLVVLLALAMGAGPAAFAACRHLDVSAEAKPGMAHGTMPEAPCHGTAPAAAPPSHDEPACAAPCCVVADRPSVAVASLGASAALAAGVASRTEARVGEASPPVRVPPLPRPGRPLYLELGRFLT